MKYLANPYKHTKDTTGRIMRDVLLALLPLVAIAFVAYDLRSIMVFGASIAGALLTEMLASFILVNRKWSFKDGSALITGLLLACTLSPLTPWYIALFGGAMAILFGKLLWGGLGKNKFNPALIGREFMVAFFPLIMNGKDIWQTNIFLFRNQKFVFGWLKNLHLSNNVMDFFYNPTGALGEYSIVIILCSAIFLICRNRISWHIPVSFFVMFFLLRSVLLDGDKMPYALGGVLIGVLFMATDMPSSPSHAPGKLFYGALLAISVVILIRCGVRFAYMSYSILILNGFTTKINNILQPTTWGHKATWLQRTEAILTLAFSIIAVTLAVSAVNYYGYSNCLLYLFAAYTMFKYYFQFQHKLSNPI